MEHSYWQSRDRPSSTHPQAILIPNEPLWLAGIGAAPNLGGIP